MGKLKEHYHDEITKGLGKDVFLDDDFRFKEWEAEQIRKEAESTLPPENDEERLQAELEAFEAELQFEEAWLASREEEVKFFHIFELTGSYPM